MATLTVALPPLFGSTAFLPFAGAITATMGAVTCGNLYGQDGTALWLTLADAGHRGRGRTRQAAGLAHRVLLDGQKGYH